MARDRLRFQPELVTALGVLGLAIALRAWAAVTLFEPVAVWGGDARVYAEILAGLEQGKLIPAAWIWPPGYPLLGLVFRPFFDPGLSLLVVSFLAGIAVPALILLAGRAAGLRTRATVAAFIVAVHPEAVMASGRPLSESSALLLTIASLIGVEAAVRSRRVLWGVGAGLLGGLAVLTRPESSSRSPRSGSSSWRFRRARVGPPGSPPRRPGSSWRRTCWRFTPPRAPGPCHSSCR